MPPRKTASASTDIPPGPITLALREGEAGGKIVWAQNVYGYTIDPQDGQTVITVAMRPAE